MLVLAVTLVLISLLLPTLGQLRENAHRVICGSNLRQIGLATVMYADEREGCLPPSHFGHRGGNKQEMMAAHRGFVPAHWEGLGWLYYWRYMDAPEVYYCPSHTGDHPYARYQRQYPMYRDMHVAGGPIYINYHYAGNVDWRTSGKRSLIKEPMLVIATDGLRTSRDFNHRTGLNVLRGDTSVNWREDTETRKVADLLPAAPDLAGMTEQKYQLIWKLILQSPHE